MRPVIKRSLRWFGKALTLAGIFFIIIRLRKYGLQTSFIKFNALSWSILTIFSVIYGLANMMLALAWHNLLMHTGAKTSRTWAIKVYGTTQLAKYTPGNIFHLAGRQAIGMIAGISGWALAKSAAWELGLLSLSGVVIGLLATPLLRPDLSILFSTIFFVCTVAIIVFAMHRLYGRLPVRSFSLYCVFLSISGFLFAGVINLLFNNLKGMLWIEISGAYILAWLAGLITPGAPAGIGIREFVLLIFLDGVISETNLLTAILFSRVVTVLGDLVFFGYASLMGKSLRAFPKADS